MLHNFKLIYSGAVAHTQRGVWGIDFVDSIPPGGIEQGLYAVIGPCDSAIHLLLQSLRSSNSESPRIYYGFAKDPLYVVASVFVDQVPLPIKAIRNDLHRLNWNTHSTSHLLNMMQNTMIVDPLRRAPDQHLTIDQISCDVASFRGDNKNMPIVFIDDLETLAHNWGETPQRFGRFISSLAAFARTEQIVVLCASHSWPCFDEKELWGANAVIRMGPPSEGEVALETENRESEVVLPLTIITYDRTQQNNIRTITKRAVYLPFRGIYSR